MPEPGPPLVDDVLAFLLLKVLRTPSSLIAAILSEPPFGPTRQGLQDLASSGHPAGHSLHADADLDVLVARAARSN